MGVWRVRHKNGLCKDPEARKSKVKKCWECGAVWWETRKRQKTRTRSSKIIWRSWNLRGTGRQLSDFYVMDWRGQKQKKIDPWEGYCHSGEGKWQLRLGGGKGAYSGGIQDILTKKLDRTCNGLDVGEWGVKQIPPFPAKAITEMRTSGFLKEWGKEIKGLILDIWDYPKGTSNGHLVLKLKGNIWDWRYKSVMSTAQRYLKLWLCMRWPSKNEKRKGPQNTNIHLTIGLMKALTPHVFIWHSLVK